MLNGLSRQIAHCYFRATECRERADRSINPTDRRFYVEREHAWLTLARSYEVQERIGRMVNELKRKALPGYLPREQRCCIKPPQCPACGVAMEFQLKRPVWPTFYESTSNLERALFSCTNCRRLNEQLVTIFRG
jgi:hypothetical protein